MQLMERRYCRSINTFYVIVYNIARVTVYTSQQLPSLTSRVLHGSEYLMGKSTEIQRNRRQGECPQKIVVKKAEQPEDVKFVAAMSLSN